MTFNQGVWSSNLQWVTINFFADVAELADALDLGSSIYDVGVQVSSSAPNLITYCGSGSVVERRLAKANVASSNLVSRSNFIYADVAELADALDLGSSIYDVGVQVSSSAPKMHL